MSPLRERMIEDMTLAGLALGTRQATPRRCAGWRCIADAHPISSAKRKYELPARVAQTGRGARDVQDWIVRPPLLLPAHTRS